jgi:hypothetical protein
VIGRMINDLEKNKLIGEIRTNLGFFHVDVWLDNW